MTNQLLDIHPRELKFIFELKKQSSCSVRVVNRTDYLVAYKVKTTSPKKYCVRPNVGVLDPKSGCDFIVTMQGQKAAPLDLICKDKFLVQSAIVPDGTTDEDITSSMFVKDEGKHVDDIKLKVILVSPPHSPELSPKKGVKHQIPAPRSILLEDHIFNGINITSQQKEKNLEDINLHKSHIIEEITSPIRTNTGVFHINEDVTITDRVDIKVPRKEKIEDIGLQTHRTNDEMNAWKNDSIGSISMQKYNITQDNTASTKHVIEDKGLQKHRTSEDIGLQKHRTSEEMSAWKNDSIGNISVQKDYTIKETTSSTKHDIEVKGLQKHRTSEDINEWKNDTTGDISVQRESSVAGVIPPTKHNTENIIPDSNGASTTRVSILNSIVGDVGAELGMKKDATDVELVKDIEILKSKLNGLESKLTEAEITISKLTEERRLSSEERESLRKVVASESRTVVRKTVQVGFPFLYVVVVAFASMVLGYRLRC